MHILILTTWTWKGSCTRYWRRSIRCSYAWVRTRLRASSAAGTCTQSSSWPIMRKRTGWYAWMSTGRWSTTWPRAWGRMWCWPMTMTSSGPRSRNKKRVWPRSSTLINTRSVHERDPVYTDMFTFTVFTHMTSTFVFSSLPRQVYII